MAQQIQALTTNVQKLMKQNEDLKRKARPKGTSMSQSRHNRNDNYLIITNVLFPSHTPSFNIYITGTTLSSLLSTWIECWKNFLFATFS